MREQSPNHSDPIPNAENWILVSDPFERPKIYRNKNAIFRASPEEGGIYVFVIEEPAAAPLLLHDINELKPKALQPQYMSLYVAPVFRLIISGEPADIGSAYPIPTSNRDGFLTISKLERNWASLKEIHMIRNLGRETAFRLKVEKPANPSIQEADPRSFRGNLDAEGTLALTQAVILFDYFRKTTKAG